MKIYCRTKITGIQGKYSSFPIEHQVNHHLDHCVNGKLADYDSCIQSEIDKITISKAGCTVPWTGNKSNICSGLNESEIAFNEFYANKQNQNNLCAIPCNLTSIYINPPTIKDYWNNDKTAGLRFYFSDMIKVSEEYPLQSGTTLLGNIGGLVGLTLGISFVNLRDVIDKILEWLEKRNMCCSNAN